MDYSKVDAQLVAYLKNASGSDKIPVFIYINKELGEIEKKFLAKYGVYFSKSISMVFPAIIPIMAIDDLSQQPWIKYIKMSHKLRPTRDMN
jgi:hypothetical protein